MELESGTETDHQPVMRHAEAVSAAARLSILGALRDWWVDNVMRAKKGGEADAVVGQEETTQDHPASQREGLCSPLSGLPLVATDPESLITLSLKSVLSGEHYRVVRSFHTSRPKGLDEFYDYSLKKMIERWDKESHPQ